MILLSLPHTLHVGIQHCSSQCDWDASQTGDASLVLTITDGQWPSRQSIGEIDGVSRQSPVGLRLLYLVVQWFLSAPAIQLKALIDNITKQLIVNWPSVT